MGAFIFTFRFLRSLILLNLNFDFNFKYFISHLTPIRSPLLLSFVLVLIEILSLFARPISLGVRIIANINARHLFLFLSRSLYIFTFNILILLILILVILSILILEFRVSFIQAYVFTCLPRIWLRDAI